MLCFQVQDTEMTLNEGLAEYYASYPLLKRGPDLTAPAARDFFHCHDVAHVVFGCDTSLSNEAVVKLSSIFGTTAGLSVLRGYALYDSLDIYRKLPVGEVLATILGAVVLVPRTISRRLRQRQRWPCSEFGAFLDTPLNEVRREFGIYV
jgi:hypothetical protein